KAEINALSDGNVQMPQINSDISLGDILNGKGSGAIKDGVRQVKNEVKGEIKQMRNEVKGRIKEEVHNINSRIGEEKHNMDDRMMEEEHSINKNKKEEEIVLDNSKEVKRSKSEHIEILDNVDGKGKVRLKNEFV